MEAEGVTDIPSPENADSPVYFVLLGASNLARGYYALARHLKNQLSPRRVRFWNALGPGRGYCARGGFLHVSYSSIETCNLWSALPAPLPENTRILALLTDVGNDIMYGVHPDQITEALKDIIRRLQHLNAEIFFTKIPAYFEKPIPTWIFYSLRLLFFPRSRVTMMEAVYATRKINHFLENAVGDSLHLITGLDSCYGWDRIHYSVFKAEDVWSRVAKEFLKELGCSPSAPIRFRDMMNSYFANIRDLWGADMLQRRKKGKAFF